MAIFESQPGGEQTNASDPFPDPLAGLTEGAMLAPDGLFSRGQRLVVDSSHVQTVDHEGLSLLPVEEVFSDSEALFLGFGIPNVYLAVPGEQGWEKYAATMFWRQPSFVADTKGRVQGGMLVELRQLAPEAVGELREVMHSHAGRRAITCARSNALVLHGAGFTSGGRSLRRFVRPMTLARHLWEHGLEHRGDPVELRVIRTGGQSISDHFLKVIRKESTSVGRVVKKQTAKLSRRRNNAAPTIEPRPMSPAKLEAGDTSLAAELRMGRPSRVGAMIGSYIGDHPIFEAIPDPANVDLDSPDFTELNAALPAYPGRLDVGTKLKKYLLFAPTPVRVIRSQLAQDMQSMGMHSGHTLTSMLQLGPPQDPFLYNAVLSGGALRVARLENRTEKDRGRANWLLAKHVLIAGYDPDVRFAGEFWVSEENGQRTVHLNNNSGTYKPSRSQAEAAGRFIEQGFGVPTVVHLEDQ